jgi:hypothetical protein
MDLTGQERNTILAALRFYQHSGMATPANRADWLHDIATNNDSDISMDDEGIDGLCEKLNFGTLPLSEDDVVTQVIRDDDVGVEAGMTIKQLLQIAGGMIDHSAGAPVTYFRTKHSDVVWVGTVEYCLEPANPEMVEEYLSQTADSSDPD